MPGIFQEEAELEAGYSLPPEVNAAIAKCLELQADAPKWRRSQIGYLQRLKNRLVSINTELRERYKPPTHVSDIAGGVDVALLALLTDCFDWPDKELPGKFLTGFDLEGEHADSGIFRRIIPHCTPAELEAFRTKRANNMPFYMTKLLKRLEAQGNVATAADFFQHTVDISAKESKAGFSGKPFQLAEFHRRYGQGTEQRCAPMPRFCIAQGIDPSTGTTKLRVIDDAKYSGANENTRTEETIFLPSFELPMFVGREIARQCKALDIPLPDITLGLEDVASAYRRIPVRDLAQSVIVFWHPASSTSKGFIEFLESWGSTFGHVSSVLNWNRTAKLMSTIAARLLACIVDAYYDDFMNHDLAISCNSAQENMKSLFELLGLPVAPKKSKPGASSNTALGMTCDLSIFATDEIVIFSPPADKCATLLLELKTLADEQSCSRATAAHVVGKLGWMLRGVAGRAGRGALQPFMERSRPGYRTHQSLTVSMRKAIEFYGILLAPNALPPRRARISTSRYMHVIVYADASGVGGIGILFINPRTGRRLYAKATCPPWLRALFHQDEHAINQLELLAAVCAILTFTSDLKNEKVLFFTDNCTCLSAIVHGYSNKADLAHLANLFCLALVRTGAVPWFEYVPTDANGADGPSRHEQSRKYLAALHAAGFQEVDLVFPSKEQWGNPALLLNIVLDK
jgi:hypothetical protein